METKERYFNLEYFLTFLLFIPLLFLFPEEAAPLRIFLLGGIVLGAAVAYISRDQLHSFRRFLTLAVSLLILAGTAYFVLKSTFLYRDVIVICIKSLSLLIVANSFSSCLPSHLNSMQIFSILLFFCICALTKGYSNLFLILSSGFIFNLLAVVRIKFYGLFRNSQKREDKYQGVNALFIIVLILSGLLAWTLFMNLPLGKIKALEQLKEEDLILTEDKKGPPLPEEQIQKELTKLTFKLSSPEEMRRVLAAIQDLLIKEKPFAFEVSKAQQDILETLNNPVLAREEKAGELRSSIKMYVGAKISNNLVRMKNEVNRVIEDNRIGLKQRFIILSSVNKLEYSNSLAGINQYDEQMRNAINNAPISDEARKQLKQLNNQLREWKAYQIYSKKFDSFQKKINALDENKKEDFSELARQISDVNTASEANTVDGLIEKIRQVALLEEDKLIDEAKQLLKLKRIMLASKEISQLRKKLEESGESVDRPPELEDALNAVEESRDAKEVLEKINKLLKRLAEDNYFKIPKEAKDILESKIENLIKESVEALKKQIRESNLPDSGEALLEGLKVMDSERQKEKIAAASAQMQEVLEKFYKQGSITKETRDNLIKEIKKIEQLFLTRAELADIGKPDNPMDKSRALDEKEKLAKLLEDLSLKNEQNERIKKLIEKLKSAQTVFQVDDVMEVLNQELEDLTKKEGSREIDKIKELMQQAAEAKKMLLKNSSLSNEQKERIDKLMDKIAAAKTISQTEDALEELSRKLEDLTKKEGSREIDKLKEFTQQLAEEKKVFVVEKESYDLRGKFEDLKSVLPQQADLLENKLDKIRESKDKQDLLKNAEALKELAESRPFEKKFETNESLEVFQNKEQQERLKIDLLPSYLILPVKSSVSLKSVAIYDNFIKEISPELEWFSSNPSVAFVNQLGLVYAKNTGEAEITCRYRGTVSRKCKVTVVEAIPQPDSEFIKRELGV